MNKSKKETLKLTKDLETEKSSHENDRERFRKMFRRQEQGFIELKKENKDLRKQIARNDQINSSIIDDLMQSDKKYERTRTESEKSAGEDSENADVDGEAFMCNICYESVSKVECIFPVVIVSILLLAEIGRKDHREDASHFRRYLPSKPRRNTCLSFSTRNANQWLWDVGIHFAWNA